MKAIIVFEKRERIRHIGHLDVMRSMQRALRRSGLPVRYSNGFNPHMLLSFASPLPCGMAGSREIMEVPLSENLSEDRIARCLSAALPDCMPLVSVRLAEDVHPSFMSLLSAASYHISFPDGFQGLNYACSQMLQLQTCPALRRTKSGEKETDIRPMIYTLSPDEAGNTMDALLSLAENNTLRPDLLVSVLQQQAACIDNTGCIITRTQLYGNNFVPLEDL